MDDNLGRNTSMTITCMNWKSIVGKKYADVAIVNIVPEEEKKEIHENNDSSVKMQLISFCGLHSLQ